jgi:hypothetical protein
MDRDRGLYMHHTRCNEEHFYCVTEQQINIDEIHLIEEYYILLMCIYRFVTLYKIDLIVTYLPSLMSNRSESRGGVETGNCPLCWGTMLLTYFGTAQK